jgi:hypothetical protein
MCKKTLFFIDSIDGHLLEYTHHLYVGALSMEGTFIFILPRKFLQVSHNLEWPTSSNIIIDLIDDNLYANNKFKLLKSFNLSRLVRKKVKEHTCNSVFFLSLMSVMPFIPLFLNKKIKISGIVYKIFLYRWKSSSVVVKFLDWLKYFLFARTRHFSRVFILNDEVAPTYLNNKFNTNVFCYLIDPILPLSISLISDLRGKLNIEQEKMVFLHFGALSNRKGTIEILKSILLVDDSVLKRSYFIFAGVVLDDIKHEFYEWINLIGKKTEILVFDKFCDYHFIGSLCLTSNYILIPYKNPEQSSGVLGYAAQFNKPVVGPRFGLLGKLIKRNNLGYLVDDISYNGLAIFFNNIDNIGQYSFNSYLESRTVSNFIKVIYNRADSNYGL